MSTIEKATDKLELLRRELASGEEQLGELLRHETALRQALLRISGAIQALEELLEDAGTSDGTAPGAAPGSPAGAATPGLGTVLTVA